MGGNAVDCGDDVDECDDDGDGVNRLLGMMLLVMVMMLVIVVVAWGDPVVHIRHKL